MTDISRAKDMKKYNVWEVPVLCFMVTEHMRREVGTKSICIRAVDTIDKISGSGEIDIDIDEHVVTTFAAPSCTKSMYGRAVGWHSGAYIDTMHIGYNIPNGNNLDWKRIIVEKREQYKLDVITGAKVK